MSVYKLYLESGPGCKKTMVHVQELLGFTTSGSIISKRTGPLLDWIDFVRAREIERLKSLSAVERNTPFIHWKYTRTGHKILRRMLEHLWEHLVEIKTRLY